MWIVFGEVGRCCWWFFSARFKIFRAVTRANACITSIVTLALDYLEHFHDGNISALPVRPFSLKWKVPLADLNEWRWTDNSRHCTSNLPDEFFFPRLHRIGMAVFIYILFPKEGLTFRLKKNCNIPSCILYILFMKVSKILNLTHNNRMLPVCLCKPWQMQNTVSDIINYK